MGLPARMQRVKWKSAMSGRPHGPYTVKNRSPVVGMLEQMAVGMRHQFVRFFRRRIKADRMIDVVVNGKRHVLVGAVDRTRRSVNQMVRSDVPRAFEYVQEIR